MNTKFESRRDYVEALQAMCEPLVSCYSEGKALVKIGYTGAPYGERIIGLEGFSRVLWGLVPLWAGGGKSCLDDIVAEGIINGTDPSHEEYWGTYNGCNQAFVEMASMGMGLIMAPEKMWEPLNDAQKQNFGSWLRQINTNPIPDNNWTFFRILVNCGLRNVGAEYSEELLEKDLARVDDFYLGDGWYSDGMTDQRDYYIAYALHFYGLVYAKLMEKEDPERCARYKERAALFAQDYIYWFGKAGESLTFGRSLAYRFAQAAFWCGLAFTDTEAMPWGVIKGIVNRHFRWWFANPILDSENKLTIGYTYPNYAVGEGYNSPCSPYWAFKSFIVLALSEDHPFWTAEEEELPELDELRFMPHAKMIIQRGADGHVTALTSGQYADWEPAHTAEKYEKFAYSSYFGFSTVRGYNELNMAPPDNMLAFRKNGLYHVRRKCKEVVLEKERIYSVWSPMEGVEVETEIIPSGNGHICNHTIHADYACKAVEGGFALPFRNSETISAERTDNSIAIANEYGRCEIKLLEGEGKSGWLLCEPNVNQMHPMTALEYFSYDIPAGDTKISVYVEGIASGEQFML